MLLLSESTVDFKYKNIYKFYDLNIVEGKFLFLLKKLLTHRNSIYHIRYIKYKNFPIAFARLFIIFLACKLTHSKVVWTCHNIYEHNIKSTRINSFLRGLLLKMSSHVIVFHEDLKQYLPKKVHAKVTVASFGDFKEFIQKQRGSNEEFQKKYEEWLSNRNINGPSIISISAAKRNRLDLLFEGVKSTEINTLVIAPKFPLTQTFNFDNILFYNADFIKEEVKSILATKESMVGFIGHDNISVPTSIYMFASYGIPVVSYNVKPVSSIINEYEIGVVIDKPSELVTAYNRIINNYQLYTENTNSFLSKNNWKNAAKAHRVIFE